MPMSEFDDPFAAQAHREALYSQVEPLVQEGNASRVRRMFDQDGYGANIIHPVIRHSAIAAAYRRNGIIHEEWIETFLEGRSTSYAILHMPSILHAAVRVVADYVAEGAYKLAAVGAGESASPREIMEARRFASLPL